MEDRAAGPRPDVRLREPQVLRLANRGDIARMMAIRAAVRENRLSDPSSIVAADYLRFIDRAHVWVCKTGRNVAGFAALDADAALVWALFVAPEAAGRGVGSLLLDGVCVAARAARLPALHLTTAAGTRAEHLYRAAGWQEGALEPDGTLLLRLKLL